MEQKGLTPAQQVTCTLDRAMPNDEMRDRLDEVLCNTFYTILSDEVVYDRIMKLATKYFKDWDFNAIYNSTSAAQISDLPFAYLWETIANAPYDYREQILQGKIVPSPIHTKPDMTAQWFFDAMRAHMFTSIKGWEPEEQGIGFADVNSCVTVGELFDILYYKWGLHNDISMLVDYIEDSCNNFRQDR